jgi:hypothetical protein
MISDKQFRRMIWLQGEVAVAAELTHLLKMVTRGFSILEIEIDRADRWLEGAVRYTED